MKNIRFPLLLVGLFCVGGFPLQAQTGLDLKINFGKPPVDTLQTGDSPYLDAALRFADTMLAHGRSGSGQFYAQLNLTDPPSNGVVGDPNRDQEVYRLLYYLSVATGDVQYREAADKGLQHFIRSTGYGIFHWGEGGGAVVENDVLPILHDELWRLHPDSMIPSAHTYWELGIRDKTTGDWDRHMPNSNDYGPFARHAGHFMMLWLDAYTRSGDRAFLERAALLTRFNQNLMTYNDASSPDYNGTYDGTTPYPGNDTNYWSSAQDQGMVLQFALRRHLHRLTADEDPELQEIQSYLQLAATRLRDYAENHTGFLRRLPTNEASLANVYYQLMDDGFYELAADYREGLVDASNRSDYATVSGSPYAGEALHVGGIIRIHLAAYKLTASATHLNRAKAWADHGIAQFMSNQELPSNTPGGSVYGRTSGGSSGGNTAAGLPMALFLLGMELEHPNNRILYIATPN